MEDVENTGLQAGLRQGPAPLPPHRPWRPLRAGLRPPVAAFRVRGPTLKPSLEAGPQPAFCHLRAHCGAGGGQLVWICQ